MENLDKLIQESFFANKEMKVDESDSAETRWNNKQVTEEKTIYDCNTMEHAKFHGVGEFSYTNEMQFNNKKTMKIKTSTDIEDMRPRPSSTIHIALDKQDWKAYNRFSVWVYPKSIGFQNFYFHFSLFSTKDSVMHAPSLTPNEWNHISFEIPLFNREEVTKIMMGPLLMGCPPEALPEIEIYFSDVKIQQVKEDYVLGWNLEDRIAYSHPGYLIEYEKKALIQDFKENSFSLVDKENLIVFENSIQIEETEFGRFGVLDFTDYKTTGEYKLTVGKKETAYFSIHNNVYDSSIWKSIHFLNSLRCGDDIEGIHSTCHITHHTAHPDGRLVSDNGGWHDAGDVSQFEICTAEMAHGLIDLSKSVQESDPTLYSRLLEEARWGLNWLLKTHFKDGYRALSVHYSVWRKNHLEGFESLDPSNTSFPKNTAENGPFENFLASASLAAGAKAFQDKDSVYANWCLRTAQKDFEFGLDGYKKGIYTKRWGKGPEVQVVGAMLLAAAELFDATQDKTYLDIAAEYAPIIAASQQATYPKWKIPLRGFFFEDPTHKTLFTFEHRGHEQTPITGLVRLAEVAKNHPDQSKWEDVLNLYAEYCIRSTELGSPYGLMPAHVYQFEKLNMDRFTIPQSYKEKYDINQFMKDQIKEGIQLDEEVYLRMFPVAIQRRGFHATLLSKTKALSAIGKYFNNKKLLQLSLQQLEWILGKNPFASSTMYGEGHNFHPLYVAFSRQIVGALPVGIETFAQYDKPYWPVINDAVYKEIWGHTTGKYLWVLADLL